MIEIYCANFFMETFTLTLFNTSKGKAEWSRVIDSGFPAYDVSFVDFTLDGKDELMLTTHVEGEGGNIFAYEVPADLRNGDFKRVTIAGGFTVTEPGMH